MRLCDAVEEFERDKRVLDGSGAPDGAKFVIVTSGGQMRADDPLPALFADEGEAVEQWLFWAQHYARKAGNGSRLFWGQAPRFEARDFVGLNQAEMLGDVMWRGSVSIRLGCVWSKLLITGNQE
jgi:hypothetical protein